LIVLGANLTEGSRLAVAINGRFCAAHGGFAFNLHTHGSKALHRFVADAQGPVGPLGLKRVVHRGGRPTRQKVVADIVNI
jgi:hypothetical protein